MILIFCTDDDYLNRIAADSVLRCPQVFNRRYQVFRHSLPMLGAQEDLFILAHRAFQAPEDGRPVIGDLAERRYFFIDGIMCYRNISPIIPAGYTGGIYIDACSSSDRSPDIESFIATLQYQFTSNGQDIAVYGLNGADAGLIELPGSAKWRRAQRY
ncbi:hypothetical protein EDF81_3358 [Enterobacter sp. BIGb0383]|nr:hypothetical protein EDF81_3358 [Enterobacter sp. BIGb0383]ROS06918.1 hypothetical protein EC848_3413 [Enterobacter sp. BIGb0359]